MFAIPSLSTTSLYHHEELWRPSKFWQPLEKLQCTPILPLQLLQSSSVFEIPSLELENDGTGLDEIPPLTNEYTTEDDESWDSTDEETASIEARLSTIGIPILQRRIDDLASQDGDLLQSCEAVYQTAQDLAIDQLQIDELHDRVKRFEHDLQSAITDCAATVRRGSDGQTKARPWKDISSPRAIRRQLKTCIRRCNQAPARAIGPSGQETLDIETLRIVDAQQPSLAHHGMTLSLCRRALVKRQSPTNDIQLLQDLDNRAAQALFAKSDLQHYIRRIGDLGFLLDGTNVIKLKQAWFDQDPLGKTRSPATSQPPRLSRVTLMRRLEGLFGSTTFSLAQISEARSKEKFISPLRTSTSAIPNLDIPDSLKYLVSEREVKRIHGVFEALSQLVYISTPAASSTARRRLSHVDHARQTDSMSVSRFTWFLDAVLLHLQREIKEVWSTLHGEVNDMASNLSQRSVARVRRLFNRALHGIESLVFLTKQDSGILRSLSAVLKAVVSYRLTPAHDDTATRDSKASFDTLIQSFLQQLVKSGAVVPTLIRASALPSAEDEEGTDITDEGETPPSTHYTRLLLVLNGSGFYPLDTTTDLTGPLLFPLEAPAPVLHHYKQQHKRNISEIYEDEEPSQISTPLQQSLAARPAVRVHSQEIKRPFAEISGNTARSLSGKRIGMRTRSSRLSSMK